MLRTVLLFSLSCLFLGAVAPSALAQTDAYQGEIDPIDIPPERDPLARAWDRPDLRGGLYLRGTFALGMQSTYLGPAPWKDYETGLSAFGCANGFTLDVGGMLAPWVALHATAHAGVLWNGDLDREFGIEDDLTARITAYGVGPAATFFTPNSFYFTLGAGVGFARTRYTGYDRWTNPGFFMSTVAGKDFYVGRHFSFGMQMQIVYMRLFADREQDEARVREFLWGFSFAYDSI